MSNILFCDESRLLLCFHVVLFEHKAWFSSLYFGTWLLFTSHKFPCSRLTMHSLRSRIISFGQVYWKWVLHEREKCRNAWRVGRFSVFVVQVFPMLQVVAYKKLSWNISGICAVAKAIFCSRRQINQQMTKRYRRCIPITVIQVPTVHLMWQLDAHLEVTWKEQCVCFAA